MVDCWAQALGDCSSTSSKEHIVSHAVIAGEMIHLKGLPWCKDTTKAISPSTFSSRILCSRHNAQLSELDQEAKRVFDVFDAFQGWKPSGPDHGITTYDIDGHLFERWLVKTSINYTYTFGIGQDGEFLKPGKPPLPLVEQAYGRRPLPSEGGMFMLVKLQEALPFTGGISFAPVAYGPWVIGGMFSFLSLTVLITWQDLPSRNFSEIFPDVREWAGWRLLRRPGVIRHTSIETGRPAQEIRFKW